ncbi:acidic repeat-containing protein-like [Coccinella septempunctata]|uniref:acidic repeat-containing protein-like n=1 Tax=Coccinella septempunctata TaxID=41139 RepID=UPI001D062F3B|nr:acidic repeat-containing protein-like [Coccinella septempunctata]
MEKRLRKLSRLSMKKHFRKSLMSDCVEPTIPNKSLTIIEISSTDSESSDTEAEVAQQLECTKTRSFENSDSVNIISPSPNKNENLNCLSTGKKKSCNAGAYRKCSKVDMGGGDYKVEDAIDSNAILEFSLLEYSNFKKPIATTNPANSTMLNLEEIKTSHKEENSVYNVSSESVNESYEKLLDNIYGESWRPYKEKVLPKSEKKVGAKKQFITKQTPATERKLKKSEVYKNPYIDNEKQKSNCLLKTLQKRRFEKINESPLIKNLKALCDQESSEQSDVYSPITSRTKLNIYADEKSYRERDENVRVDMNPESKDFCWSDKENSIEALSLEERIKKKICNQRNSKNIIEEQPKLYKLSNHPQINGLSKDENVRKILFPAEELSNKNFCDSELKDDVPNSNLIIEKNSLSPSNVLNQEEISPSSDDSLKNCKSNKAKKKYLKKYLDSSGSSTDSDEGNGLGKVDENEFEKIILTEKASIEKISSIDSNLDTKSIKKVYKAKLSPNSLRNSETKNNSGKASKKINKKINLKKYLDPSYSSSNSDEDNDFKEINKHDEKTGGKDVHSENPKRQINNLNQKVDIKTKKAPKSRISLSSSEGSDKMNNFEKRTKKNVRKKTVKNKFCQESSSNSEDSLVESFDKMDIRKANQTKTYSFLASLSGNIALHQCDPTSRIFKVNFKNTKEELAKKLFVLYNKHIFENRIPANTPIEWNARMLCTAGYCYSKKITHRDGKIDLEARIVLSSKVLTTPDRLRDTLVHEMCHAAAWVVDKVRDGHGKYWKAWADKAKKVFPELPPIKTCHNYEINSKYVYRCTGCGYSIKRHRKSLDIERKRCGHCLGKFEIFINKVNKKGEQNLVPADTPKKQPKGFALFVQENYSKYKNTNSTEIMKILSKEFKKIKVQD